MSDQSEPAAPSPNRDHDWKGRGEEWSEPWGNSAAQWLGAILPRIRQWLPAQTILEIAPGFGRWTHYLQGHCEQLILVDFEQSCIDACRRRFAGNPKLSYHCNDGRSLKMVADNSIDFVFSFDSLVHAPRPSIEAYLTHLSRKLKRDGVGFFHHSNLASLRRMRSRRVRRLLTKLSLAEPDHSRVADMSCDIFRDFCAAQGLKCIRQEAINWRGRRLLDGLSAFVHAGSKWDGPPKIWRNHDFMKEADLIRRRAKIYPALGEPDR